MLTPPSNWETLWNDQDSELEVRIRLNLGSGIFVNYTNNCLFSCSVEASLFSDLSIGNVCSARLRFVVDHKNGETEALMPNKRVYLTCRLKKGSLASGYSDQGSYIIETINRRDNGDVEVIAYDDVHWIASRYVQISGSATQTTFEIYIKSLREQCYYELGGFPSYDNLLATPLASKTGIITTILDATVGNIDVLRDAETVEARKVIESMAALSGGNIAITKTGKFKLYRITSNPTVTSSPLGIPVTAESLTKDDDYQVVTGIDLSNGSDTYASGSGWRIPASVASNVTAPISVSVAAAAAKNMFTDSAEAIRAANASAENAYITPLFELGDILSVDIGGGQFYNFTLCDYAVDYLGGCWGHVGFPKSLDAVNYSIEQTWNTTGGWYNGWVTTNISPSRITKNVEILSAHMLRIVGDIKLSSTVSATSHVIHINYGLSPVSLSVEYTSTVDGTTKTANVTAYVLRRDYPNEVINDGGTSHRGITNVYLYCSGMPDDSIGTQSTNSPVKIQNPSSSESGYETVRLVCSLN